MTGEGETTEAIALLGGQYRIERVLGKGAFGRVYLAEDTMLERKVAIKELLAVHRSDADRYDHYLKRFRREARIGASIHHPNVVTVYQLHVDAKGTHYLVLEYVDGQSLRALLDTVSALPIERALMVTKEIAQALVMVEAREIVHRDLKPANIMIAHDGIAKLTDFGIAHVKEDVQLTVTLHGHPGTPAYMSPEQRSGYNALDSRSDQFALGLVLFEMVTGALYHHLHTDAAATLAALPASVRQLIARMIAERREDRYANMQAVIEAIQAIKLPVQDEPVTTEKPLAPSDSPPYSPAENDEPGLLLERYRVERTLGHGATVVYLARDTQADRLVAIRTKNAFVSYTEGSGRGFEEALEVRARLQREARLSSRIGPHPHLVNVYDYVVTYPSAESNAPLEETDYLIMEYVAGGTLTDRIATGSHPLPAAFDLATDIAYGLEAAHDCGIVHGNLRPEAIYLTAEGRAKVGEFGDAISLAPGLLDSSGPEMAKHPVAHAYMSPEQHRGDAVDGRSDQYCLGLIVFEMLTGQMYGPLPSWAREGALQQWPPAVRALVERMTASDCDARYPSMEAVITAIGAMKRQLASEAETRRREAAEAERRNQQTREAAEGKHESHPAGEAREPEPLRDEAHTTTTTAISTNDFRDLGTLFSEHRLKLPLTYLSCYILAAVFLGVIGWVAYLAYLQHELPIDNWSGIWLIGTLGAIFFLTIPARMIGLRALTYARGLVIKRPLRTVIFRWDEIRVLSVESGRKGVILYGTIPVSQNRYLTYKIYGTGRRPFRLQTSFDRFPQLWRRIQEEVTRVRLERVSERVKSGSLVRIGPLAIDRSGLRWSLDLSKDIQLMWSDISTITVRQGTVVVQRKGTGEEFTFPFTTFVDSTDIAVLLALADTFLRAST